MKTIETVATIASDGQLSLQLQAPANLPPGDYRVVIVIEEKSAEPTITRPPLNFPVDSFGPWPPDLSLRREDIYDNDV
jgi:hypothetical protein